MRRFERTRIVSLLSVCALLAACDLGAEIDDPASLDSEQDLREMATRYHVKAQRSTAWADYEIARQAYARYLQAFPGSEHGYRLRWYYADVLYKMMDFHEAARQYARVRDQVRGGKYHDEAAFVAALCWEKCIELRDEKKLDCREWNTSTGRALYEARKRSQVFPHSSPVSGKAREISLPFFERELVQAVDAYARTAPGHDMVAACLLKAARVFLRYHHCDRAMDRFAEIASRYPESDLAPRAARMLLDIPHRLASESRDQVEARRRWAELRHWASTLRQNRAFMESKYARQEGFARLLDKLEQEASEHLEPSGSR